MNQEWDIKSCSKVCQASGQPFADGQVIYSRLTFGPQGYERADFSESSWNEEARLNALSTWKSVYHAPPPPPAEAIKKETAESLLRQFMAKEDYSQKNVIYILAVMLERKRILAERDVQVREDGTRIRVYEHKKTGEVFAIPDPGLKLGDLQHVQQEVNAMLGIQPPVKTGQVAATPADAPALKDESGARPTS